MIYNKVPKFTEKSANCTEKSEVFMLSKYASVGSRPFLYVKGFGLPPVPIFLLNLLDIHVPEMS